MIDFNQIFTGVVIDNWGKILILITVVVIANAIPYRKNKK